MRARKACCPRFPLCADGLLILLPSWQMPFSRVKLTGAHLVGKRKSLKWSDGLVALVLPSFLRSPDRVFRSQQRRPFLLFEHLTHQFTQFREEFLERTLALLCRHIIFA